MAQPRLQMHVRNRDGVAFVQLVGTMAEGSDLGGIADQLTPVTVVDMCDIDRITSPGIRDWQLFITAAEARGTRFVMVRCSPVVVEQINLVRGFLGHGLVKSFYAPYACSRCGMEQRLLIESRDLTQPKAPAYHCPRCNEPMMFDSIEDSYFGFVTDGSKVVTDDRFDALVAREAAVTVPPPAPAPVAEPTEASPATPEVAHDSVPSNPSVHQIAPFTPPPAEPSAPVAAVEPPRPRQVPWLFWLLIGIAVVSAIAWLM